MTRKSHDPFRQAMVVGVCFTTAVLQIQAALVNDSDKMIMIYVLLSFLPSFLPPTHTHTHTQSLYRSKTEMVLPATHPYHISLPISTRSKTSSNESLTIRGTLRSTRHI